MNRSLMSPPSGPTPYRCIAVLLLMVLIAWCAFPADAGATASPALSANELTGNLAAPAQADEIFGVWVLLPPLLAIALAIVTRQVVPALVVAVAVGAYMMASIPAVADRFAGNVWLVRGLRLAVECYLLDVLQDPDKIKVILFSLLIGGVVGVISANGGTRALVESVAVWTSSRARCQLVCWASGLLVFFDDYANSMIIGPTMRPVCDRLRVSRQKLAYIVDSTAAPVASLAPIGTWIGAEINFIQEGLAQLDGQVPEFIAGESAYQIFIFSIPYRFYAIFALLLVFLIGASNRDFGAMRRAEHDVQPQQTQADGLQHAIPVRGRWWYAGMPILMLVGVTIAVLLVTGVRSADFTGLDLWGRAGELLDGADAYSSILYGALGALLLGVVLSVATRALTLNNTVEAATEGMNRMFPAVVVLVLAWTLSEVMGQDHLRLAVVAKALLGEDGMHISPQWLPMVIFLTSAAVSFSTGTSWGTMGILCPVAVTVSAGLLQGSGLDADHAQALFYAAVGSVLAGAVFGDHCSPISDTTVLSSLASGCTIEQHVWTQLPYALVAAVVAVGFGDVLCSHYQQPWWIALAAGSVAMLLLVYLVGRRPPTAAVQSIDDSHDTRSDQ